MSGGCDLGLFCVMGSADRWIVVVGGGRAGAVAKPRATSGNAFALPAPAPVSSPQPEASAPIRACLPSSSRAPPLPTQAALLAKQQLKGEITAARTQRDKDSIKSTREQQNLRARVDQLQHTLSEAQAESRKALTDAEAATQLLERAKSNAEAKALQVAKEGASALRQAEAEALQARQRLHEVQVEQQSLESRLQDMSRRQQGASERGEQQIRDERLRGERLAQEWQRQANASRERVDELMRRASAAESERDTLKVAESQLLEEAEALDARLYDANGRAATAGRRLAALMSGEESRLETQRAARVELEQLRMRCSYLERDKRAAKTRIADLQRQLAMSAPPEEERRLAELSLPMDSRSVLQLQQENERIRSKLTTGMN